MPCVSIIIPVYNSSRYLQQCLDSICRQTLRDLEIICVDDGSTDECPAILHACAAKDSRITVLSHQRNRGCAAARNTGMDVARGVYIHFMDSDDWIDEGYLEELVQIAERDKLSLVMNSNIILENEDGSSVQFEPGCYGETIGFSTTGYVDCHVNIGNFTYSNCCCLYRRDYIERLAVRFPEGLDYTDNFFHIATFLPQEKIYITNTNAYHYVQHANSICGKDSQITDKYDIIDVYKLIYEYYKKNSFIDICKLNFFELSKHFHRFADKEVAFKKLLNIVGMAKDDIKNHYYLYSETEIHFFNDVIRAPNYLFYEYIVYGNFSRLHTYLIEFRKRIKKFCMLAALRRNATTRMLRGK
ncbi:glycosyltransferase family 2 protein [uncultured Desulfovibrio sp.]|uniref:glycosyltransferase family 2 protein n=1 Tax=uncultured Desulfovibrio sp. TaxID=167968 RepID=UPI0025DF1652|nr:glycosyltransferase family 2 protein [uncultured Desulfovibrio sp.]